MMITRYGDRSNFLTLFNPDLQMKVCKDATLCFFGDAPVLSELNMTYGEMTATMWLVPQLYNLSEYCGCRDKLQGKPLEECASVIATEFYWLKVSELMLFFYRFKSGKYGRFYGSIDPLIITTSLREFCNERNYAIAEHERIEIERQAEEDRKNAISYEEYVAKYVRPKCFKSNPLKDPVGAIKSGKAKKPYKRESALTEESMLTLAEEIVSNAYNADKMTLQNLSDTFKKHSGMTPKEYLNKYGNVM